ncbi:hypothetical protein BST81_06385 [Leptolyngbya sp. 'hensonii']|nr:hypothetical protein BST81_06385 [Leptolyngbya sp. 'hensonii']
MPLFTQQRGLLITTILWEFAPQISVLSGMANLGNPFSCKSFENKYCRISRFIDSTHSFRFFSGFLISFLTVSMGF